MSDADLPLPAGPSEADIQQLQAEAEKSADIQKHWKARLQSMPLEKLYSEFSDVLTVHDWTSRTKWGQSDTGRAEVLAFTELRIAPYASEFVRRAATDPRVSAKILLSRLAGG